MPPILCYKNTCFKPVSESDIMIFGRIIKKAIELKAEKVGEEISNFIDDGENILDFGCGDMTIAEAVKSRRKVSMTGVDTVNYNRTKNRLILYNGKKIPFKNSSFDTVVSSLVFHHCDDPEAALKECKRVSMKKIIVIEDYYKNAFEKFLTRAVDWVANRIQSEEINIPFNFKSVQEWEKVFSENGLGVVAKKSFGIPMSPNKYMLFVLDAGSHK